MVDAASTFWDKTACRSVIPLCLTVFLLFDSLIYSCFLQAKHPPVTLFLTQMTSFPHYPWFTAEQWQLTNTLLNAHY
jgi:hypothetical protein